MIWTRQPIKMLFLRDVTKIDQSKLRKMMSLQFNQWNELFSAGKPNRACDTQECSVQANSPRPVRSKRAKHSLNNRRSVDLIVNPQPRSGKNEILTAKPQEARFLDLMLGWQSPPINNQTTSSTGAYRQIVEWGITLNIFNHTSWKLQRFLLFLKTKRSP